MKGIFQLLKRTVMDWTGDKAPVLAAALTYYMLFSLAPLLMIAIGITGMAFGEAAAEEQISDQLKEIVGEDVAPAIQVFIRSASSPSGSGIAIVIGVGTMLFGSSMVFGQIKDALDTIWKVTPEKTGILGFLIKRFLGFSIVLGVGILLLCTLIINAVLAGVRSYVDEIEGLPDIGIIWQVADFVVSLGFITMLFAMVFKILPDVKIHWRDVWLGAGVTALLFNIGKSLIGLYLGYTSVGSTYGAAGSIVVLMVWLYYSSQIFLFGAEFTQVYTHMYGSLKDRPVEVNGAEASSEATEDEPEHEEDAAE
jgi:membrane protein